MTEDRFVEALQELTLLPKKKPKTPKP